MKGFAEWHVYPPGQPIPSPPLRDFGQGSNPEICKAFFGAINDKRAEVMRDKPYICGYSNLCAPKAPAKY